ncbi:MAG TPA: uridine kinase [Chitinophagales bacterium]|nr:uridine kinase [Chitinophagales bacterium]
MLIIGITGGSGSGKTTVVNKIMSSFSRSQVTIVSQDSYYRDNSNIPLAERADINFDHPDSIEFDLLVEHITLLRDGKPIEEPVYDYITSTRQKETIHIVPNSVVIVEGILLFTDKRVRDLCDIKVFVDAEPDDRVIRIIERDMRERGRTAEQVIERYALVKEMHVQFIEPTKRYADIIIPQGGQNQVAILVLDATIRQKLLQESTPVL